MSEPVLQVITASTRPGRIGGAVTDWFVPIAREHGGFAVETTDLAELALPMLDEPNHPAAKSYTKDHTLAWSRTVDRADAFVLVMPEYNFGYPAPLKNALDFLYKEWGDKAIGTVSYGGISGGLRATQSLRPVLVSLRMHPVNDAVIIPFAGPRVENGVFTGDERLERSAITMLDEIARVTAALKGLRTAK
jgi:NAD(P)H-dependent FMN reductase